MAHQREAVGVHAGGRHRDDDVALGDPLGAEDLVGLDDAHAGAGDVVVVVRHHPRVLGGLAADQGAAGQRQPSAMPPTISATRSGTTLPTAM